MEAVGHQQDECHGQASEGSSWQLSFVWTLLQGRALEIVEHLADRDYQKADGDLVIFN